MQRKKQKRKEYLARRKRPWRNRSSEEEQSRSGGEGAWRRRCCLPEAWEARKGTKPGRIRRCFRRLPSPTWESNRFPSSTADRTRQNESNVYVMMTGSGAACYRSGLKYKWIFNLILTINYFFDNHLLIAISFFFSDKIRKTYNLIYEIPRIFLDS